MASDNSITVFGAYGHTARFVITELRKRGWRVILSARDGVKLDAVGAAFPGSELRVATVG
jgi:short subunit dehydrogenase-like uncharacterized protein